MEPFLSLVALFSQLELLRHLLVVPFFVLPSHSFDLICLLGTLLRFRLDVISKLLDSVLLRQVTLLCPLLLQLQIPFLFLIFTPLHFGGYICLEARLSVQILLVAALQ